MSRLFILIVVLLTGSLAGMAQLVTVQDFPPRRVDSIGIERNWRTREAIILAELEFAAGDTVTPKTLATSLKKVWNIQNFATVAYQWDSLPGGRWALVLTARDGFTITPIVGGNVEFPLEGTLRLGLADRNFLGRNIRLEGRVMLAALEPWGAEAKLTIPRQLLWKNLSLAAGFRFYQELFRDATEIAYLTVVNPWHQDYRYTFSPDLEIGYLHNAYWPLDIDSLVVNPGGSWLFNRRFAYLRLSESVGTITHRRHQEEGYCVSGMIGTGIGLSDTTKNFVEASLQAQYHRLLTSRLQFSLSWEGFFHSSPYPTLWTRLGSRNIRGINYGDLTGPLLQLASLSLHYTWLNNEWLTIEQSLFAQYASAHSALHASAAVKRHWAVGTGFHFTLPMYPAASLYVSFSINPNPRNWFYVEL